VPRSFRLFAFGENKSTKGSVFLTHESAHLCLSKAKDYGNDLSGDYEHAVTKSNNEGAPASCWFALGMRSDGLYAERVRWTKRAKNFLLRREYRYYSPFFNVEQDAQGRWIVTEIINIALTNTPATKNQRPLVASIWKRLTASERRTFTKGCFMITPKLIADMKAALKEGGAPDEMLDKLTLAALGVIGSAGGEYEESAPMEPEAMADPMPEEEKPEAMAVEEVAASSDPILSVVQSQLATALKEIDALKKGQEKFANDAKDQLFDTYRKEGRLRLTTPEKAREFLTQHGEDAFKKAFGMISPLINVKAPSNPNLPTKPVLKDGPARVDNAMVQPIDAKDVLAWQALPENKGKTFKDGLRALSLTNK
jgi:phage I-like protein